MTKHINIYKIVNNNRGVFVGSTHSNNLNNLYKTFMRGNRLLNRLWEEDMLSRAEMFERMPNKKQFYLINNMITNYSNHIELIENFEYNNKLELIDRLNYHIMNTDRCINNSNLYINPLTDGDD